MARIGVALISLAACARTASAAYTLVRDYSGSNFFSGWDFYGKYDDTTNGDANFLDQADATSQKLAYVNSAGNAIIKVDNTTNVVWDNKRNTIKITSQDAYNIGTLFVIDAVHVPYGCSVWPSIWTHGLAWPQDGEIDIIEGVNRMTNNQMALHTSTGCTQAPTAAGAQSGNSQETDCSTTAGCVVAETKQNSYGEGFANANGGVWAMQFDASGIYMWFWSRADVPSVIAQSTNAQGSTIDPSSWGTPSAAYPASSCNIAQYFQPQLLTIDITLCGDWAGQAAYNQTCQGVGPTGICYNDNVLGAGSPKFDTAYFEIPFIRVYAVNADNATTTNSTTSSSSSSSSSASPSSGSKVGTGSGSGSAGSPSPTSGAAATAAMQLGTVLVVTLSAVVMSVL